MEERAERAGLSLEHYTAIIHCAPGLTDPAVTATDGAVTRICRWISAGSPEPDLSRVVFMGDDDRVREVLIRTLAKLPKPVQWHAVEHVVWRGVGGRCAAWAAVSAPDLSPAGDTGHEISFSTSADYAAALPRILAHEISHLWHMSISTPLSREFMREVAGLSRRGRAALQLAGAGDVAVVAQRWQGGETLADATSRAFGFRPMGGDDERQLAGFEAELAEAAVLVPSEDE